MKHAACLSHYTTNLEDSPALSQRVQQIRNRLEQRASCLHLPLDQTLSLLDQLLEFKLGRFLLLNRGIDGYWTSYVFYPPQTVTHPLEMWILKKSLLGKTPKARLDVFHQELQKRLQPGMHLASIPCGLMDDLLRLDYRGKGGIYLTGIDIDAASLRLAAQRAQELAPTLPIAFLQRDAWKLGIASQYDLISSNGLNMYEADEGRLCALYQQLYEALKPGGTLVISSLPPPPDPLPPSIDEKDFRQELALFQDILDMQFFNFVDPGVTQKQIESVGFYLEDTIPNPLNIGPATFIARK